VRNLLLAVLIAGIMGDGCEPQMAVNPLTGELWFHEADLGGGFELDNEELRLGRFWRSFEAARPGMFGLGFTAPWEVRVERSDRPDGSSSVRVHDPMGEGGIAPSPVPVPEPSVQALANSARQVARTLELAGEEPLAAMVRPYANRLAAEDGAALEAYWRQARAWREEAAAASKSPRGPEPPNVFWRVLLLPGWTVRYDPTFRVQVFDGQGRLQRLVDRDGIILRVERDSNGRIRRVAHRDGSWIAFDLDAAGRALRARDDEGAEATYRYDARGRLVHVRHPKGESRYTWGGPDGLLLLRAKGPSGWARIAWDTAGAFPRVVRAEGNLGWQSYSYDARRRGLVHVNTVEDESELVVLGFLEKEHADGRRTLRIVSQLKSPRAGHKGPSAEQTLLDGDFEVLLARDRGDRLDVNLRGRYWALTTKKGERVQVDYGADGRVSLVETYRNWPGEGAPEARIWVDRSERGAVVGLRFLDGFEARPIRDSAGHLTEVRFRESAGAPERVVVYGHEDRATDRPATCVLEGRDPIPMQAKELTTGPGGPPALDPATRRDCDAVWGRMGQADELLDVAESFETSEPKAPAGWRRATP
jgi:YD repeat-containing protein